MNNNNTVTKSIDLSKFDSHQKLALSSRRFIKFLSTSGQERAEACGSYLVFTRWRHMTTSEILHSLSNANFCKHRLCVMCQWRQSVRVMAEILAKLDLIKKDYRAIFVTLTVRNPEIENLRETVQKMSKAWNRFIKMKEIQQMNFAWFRAIEFLGDHTKEGEAHPHYHVLMLVNKSYFKSRYYLSQFRIQELWRKALNDGNNGIANVKCVKATNLNFIEAINKAVLEVSKYSVKASSVEAMSDSDLAEFMSQIKGLRKYAFGGLLKELEPSHEDLSAYVKEAIERFHYQQSEGKYILSKIEKI